MPAIGEMLNKLNELSDASNSAQNKLIYSQLITAFSPTADTELTFEQIASGIVLIAQNRDKIQESVAVSFFYKKTSRKAVLDGFINAIMQEYAQKPEFVTEMNAKISELKGQAQQDSNNYPVVLAAKVSKAESELSQAKEIQKKWRDTPSGTLRIHYDINDDIIDAEWKKSKQLEVEKQAQFKMAVKLQKSPGNYRENFLKPSKYLSKMLEATRQEVACEDNGKGVELSYKR